ncbi:hypothetical protein [Streptomyces sp. NPDC088762]
MTAPGPADGLIYEVTEIRLVLLLRDTDPLAREVDAWSAVRPRLP